MKLVGIEVTDEGSEEVSVPVKGKLFETNYDPLQHAKLPINVSVPVKGKLFETIYTDYVLDTTVTQFPSP